MGQAREKPFGVTLTVGPLAAGHHRQHRSGIAAQVPGARQASHWQKQQREEQACYHLWIWWAQSGNARIGRLHESRDQPAQEPGLLSRCQQQQAANPFVPDRLRLVQFFLACLWI